MLKLERIRFENEGRRIVYDYSYSDRLARYFNEKKPFFVEYETDVSQVPTSILSVPFLANFVPISWFAGFDVEVAEADATFLESLSQLKQEFAAHFSQIVPDTKVIAESATRNDIPGDATALLFSGGLDAFEALTRNLDRDPYLVSVWGADIDLADNARWNDFKRFNAEEAIISNERLLYVKSNLRSFYTHKVDLLVDISWWGKIQHGMALITLIAPLSYLKGINTVMIASSNTGEVSFGWGSTSETDEKVRWAGIRVIHDGFQFRRTQKIENVVAFAKRTGNYVKLRVCYAETRKGYNCSRCTKCQRSMLGLMLEGENPNDYGFDVPKDFYALLFRNFGPNATMTTGVAYEWRCLQEKAAAGDKLFVLSDAEAEKNNIATFAALPLDEIINRNADGQLRIKKVKFTIISKFPRLFNWYLKIRRALKKT